MKIFNIKTKEKKSTLLLGSLFFFIVSVGITASAARDAIFLVKYDRSFLPLMFVAIAFTMYFIIPIYRSITKGKDQILIITISTLVFSLSFFLLQKILEGLIIPLLFIWVEIINVLSIMQFWILAGEIFNPRQAKRLFSYIAAGGSLAAIISGYLIKPFVKTYGSENLLNLSIFFLFGTFLIAQSIKGINKESTPKREPYNSNEIQIKLGKYLKSIAFMVGSAAFISKVIDYQFKIIAVNTYPDQNQLANFFGTYYMSTGIATLIMQFFITGPILTQFGVIIALGILPFFLGVGSISFLIYGTLGAIFFSKFSDQVFRFSTNSAVTEILWIPVSKIKKRAFKPLIDGSIKSGMEGLAGLIIFGLLFFGFISENNIFLLTNISLLLILFWIWNNRKLGSGYINALMKAVKSRQLDLSTLEIDITDNQIINTINKSLKSDKETEQLFAVDLIKDTGLYPWKDTLKKLFDVGNSKLKEKILISAWSNTDIISNTIIIENIKNNSSIKPLAILCAGDRKILSCISILENSLNEKDFEIKGCSSVSLLKMDCKHKNAKKILDDLLNSNNNMTLKKTLALLTNSNNLIDNETFYKFLNHDSIEIRKEAIKVSKSYPSIDLINPLLDNLSIPSLIEDINEALKTQNELETLKKMSTLLERHSTSIKLKKGIYKSLKRYQNQESIDMLFKGLKEKDISLVSVAADSIYLISKKKIIKNSNLDTLNKHINRIAKYGYLLHIFSNHFNLNQNTLLLKDHIDNDLKEIIPILLKLGILENPEIPLETYIQYFQSQDEDLLPIVLELVDSVFSKDNRNIIIPLIDNDTDKIKKGYELYPNILDDKKEILITWVENDHYWKSVISIDYLLNNQEINILNKKNWDKINCDIFSNNFFSQLQLDILQKHFHTKLFLKKEKDMYSNLEKTIILKSVELFENIPGDVLSKIAQIASEVHLEPNQTLFKKDELGNSMYIIISGKITVHQNNEILTQLENGSFLGEMSLLDHKPRSADATSKDETILLEISQEGFYELLIKNPEIMRQIMKQLTHRIREMNIKLQNSPK